VVTERGIRVQNRETSTATYRLALPRGVRRVRVRIADEPPVVVSLAQLEAGWSHELSSAAP
jgi:hypothetical protein